MNLIGLDLASVGNHEFDEGAAELKRMQRLGCHPADGCKDADGDGDGDGFAGADFRYLAANVIDQLNAKPFFKPYAIRRFQGKKIGFIGMTLEGTPSIVARRASRTCGTNRTTLSTFDIDSLVKHLGDVDAADPIGPPALDRIDVTP